jgi:mRNA-degrading endonuclease RelE of RelBE toxin-antitoxin system
VRAGRTIVFTREAAREYDSLDSTIKIRIEAALDQLARDPLGLRNQIKRLQANKIRIRIDLAPIQGSL